MSASRHATGRNAHGLAVPTDVQALGAYERLLSERDAAAVPLVEPVELTLYRIAPAEADGLALVPLATPVSFLPSAKSQLTSSRFRKSQRQGWEFLDGFFAGGIEWTHARDEDVWQAALEAARSNGYGTAADEVRRAPGLTRGLWMLNRLVALALIHRRGGVHVKVTSLPTV